MDIATIVGLIAAVTCLMVGIGPRLLSVIEAAPLIVVVGGTLATVLIANPLRDAVNLIAVWFRAVFSRRLAPDGGGGVPGALRRDRPPRRHPLAGGQTRARGRPVMYK